jgi:hypothetical protein
MGSLLSLADNGLRAAAYGKRIRLAAIPGMASQDCHTALAGCARESCEDRLGFGNPSQQSPNIILITGIAVRLASLLIATQELNMLQTVWAVIHDGKIEPLEGLAFPEGAKVIVTLLPEEDDLKFWLSASETSLAEIWENAGDDTYADIQAALSCAQHLIAGEAVLERTPV